MKTAARPARLFSPGLLRAGIARIADRIEEARTERDIARFRARLSWHEGAAKDTEPRRR